MTKSPTADQLPPPGPSNLGYRDPCIFPPKSQQQSWWTCPHCGRTLGEVRNGVLLVKAGDRWLKFTLTAPVSQRCPNPRCGEWSELHAA